MGTCAPNVKTRSCRFDLCSVASALLSLGPTSVFAADLSLTPPPPRAPLPVLFTWTGLYFGINGGYGWGRVNTVNQDGNTFSFNANGGLIGATLGFNYQWNWFVAGVEGDVDVSGMHWKQTSTGSSNAFLGLPQTATGSKLTMNVVKVGVNWLFTERRR